MTIVLDPAVKAILDIMGEGPYLDLDAMPIDQAMRIARTQAKPSPPPPHSKDIIIKGYQGADIRMRLYYPNAGATNLPILLHLHGGGFVGGSIEMDDARCAGLARNAACLVASLDYRLAPEHIFPVAIEDAFCAWQWLMANAASVGSDSRRAAISGSSAGGHIAVGMTLVARSRHAPMPVFQLLTYPVIDPGLDMGSYRDYAHGPFMTKARMAWYWKQYAGDAAHSGELWSPLSTPATGLPPAHVITAEYDVLRDEGEAYAAHLRKAGVAAAVERHAGMIHGFVSVVPTHPASIEALENSAVILRKAFAAVLESDFLGLPRQNPCEHQHDHKSHGHRDDQERQDLQSREPESKQEPPGQRR
jgi:acetyl esterase